jgi:hypothetical protein
MARYNSQITVNSISSAYTTPLIPQQGVLTEFTGTGGYTVQLPNPTLYPGVSQQYYNASSGTVTLSLTASSGSIVGPGTNNTTTVPLSTLSSCQLYSDGTNWIASAFFGSAGSFTTLSTTGATTFSPAALVTISPTGGLTIAPATVAGTMDNVAIGNTTPSSGKFTTLSASSTVSGSGFSTYLASPPAIGSSAPSTGAFSGLTMSGLSTFQNIQEILQPVASPGSNPTLNYGNGDIFYLTSLSANFVPNFTNVPSTSARTTTITLILVQGGTPYYPTSIQIGGTGYSITWPGGTAPTPRASKVEICTLYILNSSGSFNYVLGSYGSFG